MKTEKLSFGFEPIPPERTFQKKVWFPHRQQVGTSGIEPLSRQTRWIFSRCLSIRPCVHVHRIPRQKYPMPLQFFFKCNFAAKSTHADCCVKSPPGLEPGTYSKKGLKEKLLFQLSYDDIFVAVSVKSGYDNVIFRQPPPGVGRVGFGPTNQLEPIYSRLALTTCIPAKNYRVGDSYPVFYRL